MIFMVPSVVKMRTNHGRARSRAAACAAAVTVLTAGFLVSTAGSAQAIATEVPLGVAESFAVLAGAGVTNIGETTITGDVGTAPTPAITGKETITMVPPSAYYEANAVARQAKTDLVTGYNNAAGQARDADSGGELGGQTLVAGVYGTDSTLGLTGTVTLDGGGRTDGVWVFQVGSGVTTASSSSVSLTNGAQACNVYWQVGSSATPWAPAPLSSARSWRTPPSPRPPGRRSRDGCWPAAAPSRSTATPSPSRDA